jgi:ribosomal protein S12 methylthiotransferase accessory factor
MRSGQSSLVEALAMELADLPGSRVRLAVDDRWHAPPALDRAARPTLHVRRFLGQPFVGPLEEPGRPGCAACAQHRLRFGSATPAEVGALMASGGSGPGLRGTPLTAATCQIVAAVVGMELRALAAEEPAMLRDHLFLTDPLQSAGRFVPFVPYGGCLVCGGSPDDGTPAPLRLEPALKPAPTRFRAGDAVELADRIEARYVGPGTGMITPPALVPDGVFPLMSASVPTAWSFSETAVGRSHSYHRCRSLAILEGLERYAGWHLGGNRRPSARGSYAALLADAVDPASFGLHEEEAYGQAGFPFHPYSPDTELEWSWAYSLTQDRPRLVPYAIAHYGTARAPGSERGFVYENSNGCALGSTLAEAILYGLLEVIERDAFLLMWYARLAAKEIDLASASGTELRLMVGRFCQVTGRELRAFSLPNEAGIPAVCLLTQSRATGAPAQLLAAGAHLDPEQAAISALHELGAVVPGMTRRLQAERPRVMAMLGDPVLVQHMDDHALLGALPEASDRFTFLTDQTGQPGSFRDSFPAAPVPALDLRDDLNEVVGRCAREGLDVLVVDHTPPELRDSGLSAVKVIVPGMLPMTFGHAARRTRGLPRLRELPRRLGFLSGPLEADQINPYPHPFP